MARIRSAIPSGDVKRRDHPLWAEDEAVFELARLAAILISFRRNDRDPIKGLVKGICDHAQSVGNMQPDEGDFYQEIYRLVSFSHLTNSARVLDAIAEYVLLELGKIRRTKDAKYFRHIFARIDLSQAFDDYRSNKLQQPVIAFYGLAKNLGSSSLSDFPRVFPHQFEDASKYLTGVARTADDKRSQHLGHYACYRYSVVLGSIARSHFEFQPCCDGDPVCRFENVFRDRSGAYRNSSGLVFSTGDWLYLVGQLRREHSVKVLAMRATGQSQPDIIPALLMSKSITPLIGRAVLRRATDRPPPDEIRVRDERMDPEFTSEEFQRTMLPFIRNDMEFRLEQKIVFKHENGRTETFTQSRMVEFLPSLIRGEFFLQDAAGKLQPFNPAAHEYYPFNQAIVIRE